VDRLPSSMPQTLIYMKYHESGHSLSLMVVDSIPGPAAVASDVVQTPQRVSALASNASTISRKRAMSSGLVT
jgi:hypothetical protein